MNISKLFQQRQAERGLQPLSGRAILTVAMDEHNVHCMTEDMLDEWFRSLSTDEKAEIFDAHLGAPEMNLTGLVGLNAITEGLPL